MKNKNQKKRILPLFLGVALLTLTFWVASMIFTPFKVSGESMAPTFKTGEALRINKLAYVFKNPERGDMVVFLRANEDESEVRYLKRIIGLPGETVLVKNGSVFIKKDPSTNPEELIEPYLEKNIKTLGNQERALGEDEYFVMGDNRSPNASIDSRIWGPIKFEGIVGRAW